MTRYKLSLPDDFDDFAWEVLSKGCLNGVMVAFEEKQYRLSFYDPVRLAQEVSNELANMNVFFESNLLVIKSVDRFHIEKAVDFLASSGKLIELRAD